MLKRLLNYVRADLVITYEFFSTILFALPRYPFFNNVKSLLLKLMGAKIGRRPIFYPGVWINTGRNLVVGDDVNFAKGVLITTDGGVEIGDRALLGYGVHIISSNHAIPPIGEPYPVSGKVYKRVIIEKDVWVGDGCIILPGVHIGVGALISAGSIVTHDVPDNAIVAGVPAKIVRMREAKAE